MPLAGQENPPYFCQQQFAGVLQGDCSLIQADDKMPPAEMTKATGAAFVAEVKPRACRLIETGPGGISNRL
jgi:hypothetical protein